MKERPILFSGAMVRAILSGQKTQTRRVVKPSSGPHTIEQVISCPYGQPGDRLYVRESFSYTHGCGIADVGTPIWYWADGNPKHGDWTRPKPPIHMPRWACRIVLEIVSVRVERLQDISVADALAEGIERVDGRGVAPVYRNYLCPQIPDRSQLYSFQTLWQSINGAGSWEANPWVWVVEFKRVQQ